MTDKPSEIELARQIGYNEAYYIYKKKVEKLNKKLEIYNDVVKICKLKLWDNEIGDEKAQKIIDKIHNGKYGDGTGLWIQVPDLIKDIIDEELGDLKDE